MKKRQVSRFAFSENWKGVKKLFSAKKASGSETFSFVFMLSDTRLTLHRIFSKKFVLLSLFSLGMFLFLVLWLGMSNAHMYMNKIALEEQNAQTREWLALYREELKKHSLLFARQEPHFLGTLKSWKEQARGDSLALGGSRRAVKGKGKTKESPIISKSSIQNFEEQAFQAKQKRFDRQEEKLLDILKSDFQSMDEGLDTLQAIYQNISQNKIFHDSMPLRWPLQYGLGELLKKEKNTLHFSVLPGAAVLSPSDGRVMAVIRNKNRPHLWDIKIKHEFGFFTEYRNLAYVHVLEGDLVKAGNRIAESSDTLLYTVRVALQERDAERYTFMRY